MNHVQLPIPEYRRKGFSLLGDAFSLFFKHAFPILFFVAIIAVPVEAIKNYYYFEPGSDSGFLDSVSRWDNFIGLFFLSVITPMIVHYLLGQMTASNAAKRQSLLWGMRKWVRMIMYGFLQNVILLAGIIMLVVPGLIFAVWLMLMPIFVSAEDTSRSNPLQECRGMARGRFFKFAGYAVVGYAVIILISAITGLFSAFIPNESWITATIFDVWIDWFSELITVVFLLVYLQVKTETRDLLPEPANPLE
ncbi:hypothetical protein [Paenibacillus sp. FJAT-27812]|uniref:hypothetical protein n=1 Tax=Paenibacillus sp. FJAT-27812 TaxID=1684143 RepID=UPI0006A7A7B2|nr:hypothetical protein [Paenibacillus sp. FJAT-27812]